MRHLTLRATYGDIVSLNYDSLVEQLQEEGQIYDDWSDLDYEVVRMPNFEDLRPGDRIMLEGEAEWLQVKAVDGLCSVQGDVTVIVLDDYSLVIGYDGHIFHVDGLEPVYVLREGKDLMHSEHIPDAELDHALKVRKKDTTLYNELLRLKADRAIQAKEEK